METGWLRNWLSAVAKSAEENHYGNGSITWHQHPILPPFLSVVKSLWWWQHHLSSASDSSSFLSIVFSVFGLITQVSSASVSLHWAPWTGKMRLGPQRQETLALCPGFLSPSVWQSPSVFLLFIIFFFWDKVSLHNLDCPWAHSHLALATPVAGITGKHHHAWLGLGSVSVLTA